MLFRAIAAAGNTQCCNRLDDRLLHNIIICRHYDALSRMEWGKNLKLFYGVVMEH